MDRFTDCDHFMQQRGWGVGHLSTRHCNNALLRDRHTLLHDNVDVPTPENEDEEALSGHASDEGDLEEDDLEEGELEEGELEGGELEEGDLEDDEGAVDIFERNLGDEYLIAAAGYSVL